MPLEASPLIGREGAKTDLNWAFIPQQNDERGFSGLGPTGRIMIQPESTTEESLMFSVGGKAYQQVRTNPNRNRFRSAVLSLVGNWVTG